MSDMQNKENMEVPMRKLKKTGALLLFLFVTLSVGKAVYAHAPMSDFYPNPGVNEGVVRFFFDDDEFMSDVSVTVYDTFGVQIGTGVTDARGHFDFSGFENVGHLIARYDADHIQIHVVAASGAYIVGKNFGGTYIPYDQLGALLRDIVVSRWWFGIYVLAIPGGIFALSLVFFIVTKRKGGKHVA